ncbi:hypothetical protein V757_03080 [Pelistega indica]|uniref:Uncharacterized protein n=1 Tax=Pelistega indica TaxID=1414851 RepID=V8G9N2_9BURK|nr:AAA family ATPase [Pelistega indica]ETD72648.1 hypothetical protein V757_03080 [Pelistega indica]
MKFHLENVGKITSADIELKPLTIFIGQNGTGKTYAASAIWSIVRYIKTQPVNALLSKSTYTHYKNIVDTVLQNWKDFNKTSFTLDAKDLEALAQDIQKTLLSNGSALLTNTFSADFFQHAILQFDIPTYQSFNVTLSLKPSTPLNDTYHEDKKS